MSHIAYVYTQALLNHVQKPQELEKIVQKLQDLTAKISPTSRHRSFQNKAFQEMVLQLNALDLQNNIFEKWLRFIAVGNHLRHLPQIHQMLSESLAELRGQSFAYIEVTHTLAPAEEKKIIDVIESKFKTSISPVFLKNKDLVSGFRVWVQSFLWDVSIKGWSERLLMKIG